MKIKVIRKTKGGPGSGNWGHAGRPGMVGGSISRSHSMSLRSGTDWLERYQASSGKPHSQAEEAKIYKQSQDALAAEAKKKADIVIPNPGGKLSISGNATYDGHSIYRVGDGNYNLAVYQISTGKLRGQRMEGEYGKESWGVYRIPGEGYRQSVSPVTIKGIGAYKFFGNRKDATSFAKDVLRVADGLKLDGSPILSEAAKQELRKKYPGIG